MYVCLSIAVSVYCLFNCVLKNCVFNCVCVSLVNSDNHVYIISKVRDVRLKKVVMDECGGVVICQPFKSLISSVYTITPSIPLTPLANSF